MIAVIQTGFPTLKCEVGRSGEVGEPPPPTSPPVSYPPFRGGAEWGSGVGSGGVGLKVGKSAGAAR